MSERNIKWLPLRTAFVLTRNWTGNPLILRPGAEPTETHQPRQWSYFKRKRITGGLGHLVGGNRRVFILQIASFFGGQRKPRRQTTSLVLTRKFQTSWLKIMFLGEVETAIRSGITCRFGSQGLRHKDTVWGLWFFSLTSLQQDFLPWPATLSASEELWTASLAFLQRTSMWNNPFQIPFPL